MNQKHARGDECADSVVRLAAVFADVVHRDVVNFQASVFENVHSTWAWAGRENRELISLKIPFVFESSLIT